MAANIRCIMRAKAPYGQGITKMKVNLTPEQSSTPSLMPETNTVFLSRPTEGTGELMELVGGTVAWNQLCNSSSVTGTSGHKFYLKKSGAESITNTNTFTGLASGTDMVIDLTQMLNPTIADYVYSLEQATAGSGIQWLKDYDLIDDEYHAYSAPTLQSVEASAHVTVGFNQWDEEWENGTFNTTTGADIDVGGALSQIRSKNNIRVIGGETYYFKCRTNTVGCGLWVMILDANENIITPTPPSVNYSTSGKSIRIGESSASSVFQMPLNAYYIKFYCQAAYGSTYKNDICINLSNPSLNGTYEPYTSTTYPLDSDLVLRGIPKLTNGVLSYDGDTYEWDGTVTRYFGERTYQAGDESLTDAITDGTNTVYKLTTPTTESADPFTAVQTVEDGGTEEFTTSNNVPVGVVGRFANAVPMEGVDSFTVTANDGTAHSYPVTLSEEIYRGYVDMLTGEAVSDMASIAEYNGETINSPWLSSLDVYSAGATPTNGAQVVYPITPEEVTATITGDPSELSGVVSATSTEGTVEWSELSEIGIKCIMKRKNPFQ